MLPSIITYEGPNGVKLLKWKIKPGHRLTSGTLMFIYSNSIKYKSNNYGTTMELLVKEGDTIYNHDPIVKYIPCSHPTVMKDLCAECGRDLRELEDYSNATSASVCMVHSVPELRVTQEQAEKLGKDDETRLLKDEKLVLLVDLDQTLIHSTNEPLPEGLEDVFKYQLYGPNSPWYFTKLRPHTTRFLENISKLYELHICTFGARMYAHKIAELIDPNQKFFSHRILSRDECFDPTSKTGNLKALFPCGDSLVCIIDDRQDVWNFSPNLIAVKPYFYFKNTGDINSPYKPKESTLVYEMTKVKTETEETTKDNQEPSTSTSENKPIEDTDDYLLYLEDILQRIHKTYFHNYKDLKKYVSEEEEINIPDLKKIIPLVRKKTLQGVNIVFSGLIPTNMPPEKSKLYSMAISLGANVTKDIILNGSPLEKTTHLIASKFGTMKVTKALKCDKIKIVNPHWLYCCSERWEKVDEILFELKKDDNFEAIQDKPKSSPTPTPDSGFEAGSSSGESSSPTNAFEECPVYDSVTGKKISKSQKDNLESAESKILSKPSSSKVFLDEDELQSENMHQFSSLSGFSKNDLQLMDKEVDDACSEGDGVSSDDEEDNSRLLGTSSDGYKRRVEWDSDEEADIGDEDEDEEGEQSKFSKNWNKSKKCKFACTRLADDDETRDSFAERSDSSGSDEYNESIGSVDEEMAAAVEREFLS
ncbi:RNA polymerase II subunit A C-terminal domain phosphatase [Tetranychus urticae]|uniref:RNA polymerase II subunit A C-terminal domain phosphatase n=1 Tax=Tetranychus urticae TaxID=32264 RepID=T1K4P5_TETUR|nr:RNA polymerase II subunit A C-terminal domain phosphatase [Tetranychus urticae]